MKTEGLSSLLLDDESRPAVYDTSSAKLRTFELHTINLLNELEQIYDSPEHLHLRTLLPGRLVDSLGLTDDIVTWMSDAREVLDEQRFMDAVSAIVKSLTPESDLAKASTNARLRRIDIMTEALTAKKHPYVDMLRLLGRARTIVRDGGTADSNLIDQLELQKSLNLQEDGPAASSVIAMLTLGKGSGMREFATFEWLRGKYREDSWQEEADYISRCL